MSDARESWWETYGQHLKPDCAPKFYFDAGWQAAETARLKAGVPEGWQLVPKQLPGEVRDVLIRICHEIGEERRCLLLTEIWSDLIAASPRAPEQDAAQSTEGKVK